MHLSEFLARTLYLSKFEKSLFIQYSKPFAISVGKRKNVTSLPKLALLCLNLCWLPSPLVLGEQERSVPLEEALKFLINS